MPQTLQLPFKSEHLPAWLALHRVPGLGPKRLVKLLRAFITADSILRATHDELLAQGISEEICRHIKTPNWSGVEQDMTWQTQSDRTILTWLDSRYPPFLREIAGAPPVLFVQGDPSVLTMPQLAMVGSRNPSHTGLEIAYQFAQALAEAGFIVTSGLASGIDGASHQGALTAKRPTIAVMATGLDKIYPARHNTLAQQIAVQGALVSEFPIGSLPKPEHFPHRNRVISGLSLGVLVVEAALRSGSLITARYAVEQGREVFAIPGSIHNPLARGCHALLREGAKLVETIADILEELSGMSAIKPAQSNLERTPSTSYSLDYQQTNLIKCMGSEVTSLDRLVERSGLTAEAVSSMLLKLELQGHIVTTPGGFRRYEVINEQ